MNFTISGRHVSVTPAMRNYVASKMDRVINRFDQVVDISVVLSVENQTEKQRRQRAECSIHVPGNAMFAHSTHADLYAAVDDLVDKLDRQVIKHKQKVQKPHYEATKRLM